MKSGMEKNLYPQGIQINNPKVSVLMSVFNGENYIKEAIDSILSQTYKNFEFLIINDGSVDNTAGILKGYADSRIKIHSNKIKLGLTKSLNLGLKMATGEYIARQDADDISLPTRLQKGIKLLDEKKEIGLLGMGWYIIDGKGKEIGLSIPSRGKLSVHFMCHGTIFIRRKCLEKIGLYRDIFEYAQDYDLWLRIGEEFEIENLREPLYKLRVHEASISTREKLKQDLYASLAIEMAEERKKYGKDRLNAVDKKEAVKIMEKRLRVSGIKRRRALAFTYSTWGRAAYALGEYNRSINFAIRALNEYILDYRAWSVVLKNLTKKAENKQIMSVLG